MLSPNRRLYRDLEAGEGVRLLFDTGAFMTVVGPRFFQRHAAHFRPVHGERMRIAGVVGYIGEEEVFRIVKLQLGPISLDGHEVVVVDNDSLSYDIILGASSIIQQDWILDLGTQTWDAR